MERLLQALGSPHHTWPAIHVAGTKGKGSTATMISSILAHSGYTVGTYTSPHIVYLHERISLNGNPITDSDFDALVSKHSACIDILQQQENNMLSHFEVLTALAFKYFQEQRVDVAVVEVGLGGARDATNVLHVEKLLAAVITSIGNDHAAALGGTMESIAEAKAGIMKQSKPVVIGQQSESVAEAVVRRHASELQCRVYNVPELVHCQSIDRQNRDSHGDTNKYLLQVGEATNQRLDSSSGNAAVVQRGLFTMSPGISQTFFSSKKGTHDEDLIMEVELDIGLLGQHQLRNAATAITAISCILERFPDEYKGITFESLRKGLARATLPGRFQMCVKTEKIQPQQPPPPPSFYNDNNKDDIIYVVDGAHTMESARALVDTAQGIFPKESPRALVLAMASDKQHEDVCKELLRLRPSVVVFAQVPIASSTARSASPGVLTAAWQSAMMQERKTLASHAGGVYPKPRELIQASLTAAVYKAERELRAIVESNKNSTTMAGMSVWAATQTADRSGEGVVDVDGQSRPFLVICGSLHVAGAALQHLDIRPLVVM